MKDLINSSINKHSEALQLIDKVDIINSANMILKGINNGNTIFWCGNGGSASQANHLSAELLGGMYQKKIKPSENRVRGGDLFRFWGGKGVWNDKSKYGNYACLYIYGFKYRT